MELLAFSRQKNDSATRRPLPHKEMLLSFMVILKSTAPVELPLNLGVEVKKVLLIYFERHARLYALGSARKLNAFFCRRASGRRGAECFNN